MSSLTFEQLKELTVLLAPNSILVYTPAILSILVSAAALFLSFYIFKRQADQFTKERVIEKEVDKLYQAVDCFFEYSDTANLFFSMQEKHFEKLATEDKSQETDSAGFHEKLKLHTDSFHTKISQARKASFLLQVLGEETVSKEIDDYRIQTIHLRKLIFENLNDFKKNKDRKILKQQHTHLISEKNRLEKIKTNCLNSISKCNLRAKGTTN